MPVTLPVTNERAYYRQVTQLDGVDYVMRFNFNQRLCRWFLSVSDADDNPIVQGMRLSANFPLGRGPKTWHDNFPKGRLLLVDLQAEINQLARDPCLLCLGDRHVVMYYEEAEVSA